MNLTDEQMQVTIRRHNSWRTFIRELETLLQDDTKWLTLYHYNFSVMKKSLDGNCVVVITWLLNDAHVQVIKAGTPLDVQSFFFSMYGEQRSTQATLALLKSCLP